MIVISPHLDDATLSTSDLLREGASIINVFDAVPEREVQTSWDKCCGFEDGREHMRVRLSEEEAVSTLRGALSRGLGYLQSDYRAAFSEAEPEAEELALVILGELPPGESIAVPAAISPHPHPDHVLVRDAGVALASEIEVTFYADVPHCVKSGDWPPFIRPDAPPAAKCWSRVEAPIDVERPEVVHLDSGALADKMLLCRAYSTQFKALNAMIGRRVAGGKGLVRKPHIMGIEARWRAQ